ncbi:uncharacterized protein LOC111382903 [Olea europaea var. sylvestris]|uniref:uncharacterized protein LOC111382903 n=1 Tax=Olea europaea var. sylvestris TaxID=158386 RepID=UPI000C1D1E6E|nr:uncharacterized protein LOC111382903 [Olea europaea var. sylvestris]
MEYHIDNDLRAHSGKVTTYCNFSSYATVLEGLDEEHIDLLRRSFLWSFYPLKDVQFSGQIVDSLLLRLLKPVDGDQLYFAIGDGKLSMGSEMLHRYSPCIQKGTHYAEIGEGRSQI